MAFRGISLTRLMWPAPFDFSHATTSASMRAVVCFLTGDPCGEGSEAGGGAKTAAGSQADGRVENEEPTFRVSG